MKRLPCRDCHKPIPGGSRAGHCGKCHESFSGEEAWEAHLLRDGDHPTHLDPATAVDRSGNPKPFWQDDSETWHHGPRMDVELFARVHTMA